jgi:hypothetical protein
LFGHGADGGVPVGGDYDSGVGAEVEIREHVTGG